MVDNTNEFNFDSFFDDFFTPSNDLSKKKSSILLDNNNAVIGINPQEMFEELTERAKQNNAILLSSEREAIYNVISRIPEKYQRGYNTVYQFQLFLNGNKLEHLFLTANSEYLTFIENNHDILEGGMGHNIPDFNYTAANRKIYTIDTKTYYTLNNFTSAKSSQFENADFVIAFIMKESKFYIRAKLARGGYSNAYSKAALPMGASEILSNLQLPKKVDMIKFVGADFEVTEENLPQSIPIKVNHYNNVV